MSNEELLKLKESSEAAKSEKKKGFSWKSAVIFGVTFILVFFVFKFFFKKDVEKTYCECYKWGQDISKKEIEALAGNSDQMKEFENERDKFREECNQKMNPIEMSEKKKFLEEIEKCK